MRKREKRRINKLKIGIVVFIFLTFLLTITGFARYMYNNFRDRYLTSKKFYFTSDLLEMSNKDYTYNNWDGGGIYSFDIELYSKNNDLQVLEDDLEYDLTVTRVGGSKYINYAINTTEFVEPYEPGEDEFSSEYEAPRTKTDGKIMKDNNNSDKVTIYLKAIDDTQLKKGDEIELEVKAYTTEPYRKVIIGTFKIQVETTYSISDQANQKYAILSLRNTTDEPKEITLDINADELYLDMNDDAYIHCKEYKTQDTEVDGVECGHVEQVVFDMDKESMREIKLYKREPSSCIDINSGFVTVTSGDVN